MATCGCCPTADRPQALPVLLACLHDARNPSDLALRQAASTALAHFITAAGEVNNNSTAGEADDAAGDGLAWLVPRMLYPQVGAWLVGRLLWSWMPEHPASGPEDPTCCIDAFTSTRAAMNPAHGPNPFS